jgi:hypothetical protein
MQVDLLVPGHGNLARDPAEIRRRIDADRAYLADLRKRVEAVVLAGGSVQDATAACADMTFRNPGENAEAHAMNVEQGFLELGGARPAGTRLGWERE